MDKYLLKYIQRASKDELTKKYIDFLKVNLDGFFYAKGGDVNINYGALRKLDWRFYLSFISNIVFSESAGKYVLRERNILSFVPLPASLAKDYDINLVGSFLQPIDTALIKNWDTIKFKWLFSHWITQRNFNEMVTDQTVAFLEEYNEKLMDHYSKYNLKALFVSHGEPFLYKYHIDIFKKLNRPSFIFLHGLPAIYNLETEKNSDYLLVWGDKIKENYVNAGFEGSRIIVTGHHRFKSIPVIGKLRNSFDDILVATTASNVWSPHDWDYGTFPIYDSSLIVLYCYSVQNVLQGLGIKHVRLRLHPSVNKKWIKSFIDNDFYILDTLSLSESLNKATLVIGPTSTTCLEAMFAGVNYVVYELGENKHDIHNFPLVPPFDGSDDNLVVTNTEGDLSHVLKSGNVNSPKLLDGYLRPFDFGAINNVL